jgi:hypothetical protein
MPGTFPWPRTEAETVDHLRTQHGTFVRSLDEWRALFGGMRGPIRAHEQMHSVLARHNRPHSHTGNRLGL